MVKTFWGCSTGCFIYSLVTQVISEKTLCNKGFIAIWEIFLHENNRNCNSYMFSYKFAFILFLSLLINQKQESGFQHVDDLVTRNIFDFCLVALYFKAMPNSIDFYKIIFWHVIPVHIIVPWSEISHAFSNPSCSQSPRTGYGRHMNFERVCLTKWFHFYISVSLESSEHVTLRVNGASLE